MNSTYSLLLVEIPYLLDWEPLMCNIAMSFISKEFYNQILCVGTWMSQLTFVGLYLREITHKDMDMFLIRCMVGVQ